MYVDPLGEYYIEESYNNIKGTLQYRIVEKDYVSSQIEGLVATGIPVVGDAVVAYALEGPMKQKGYIDGNSLLSVKDALSTDVLAVGSVKQLTSMRLDSVEHFLQDAGEMNFLKNAGKIFTAFNYGSTIVKQEKIPQYDRTVMRLVELLGGDSQKIIFRNKDDAEGFMTDMYRFINDYDNKITKMAGTLTGDTKNYFTKNGKCFRTTMDSYEGVTYHFNYDLIAKKQENKKWWEPSQVDSYFVEGYDKRLEIVKENAEKIWNQYKHKII